MYQISKMWSFDAAHHLPGLPAEHKCSRVHGHTWNVRVTIEAEQLTPPGFVTDFGDLAPFGSYLAATLDHQDLNEVLDFPPTSELLAQHLADWFIRHIQPGISGRLSAVRVSETPSTWAECRVVDR